MDRPAIHGAGADCALMVKDCIRGVFFLGVISNKFFCNFLNSFFHIRHLVDEGILISRVRDRWRARERSFGQDGRILLLKYLYLLFFIFEF